MLFSMTTANETMRVGEAAESDSEVSVATLDWLVILSGEFHGIHLRPARVPSFEQEAAK